MIHRLTPFVAALALGAAALVTACATPRDGGEPAIVIEHATVLDGRGGAALADRDIAIAGERIVAVYPSGSRPAPAGARRIDATGKWVIPGLIDAHVHLGTRGRDAGVIEMILANVLRNSGVTTVRDMGGHGPLVQRLKAAARNGAVSPQIVAATLVTGPASDFWLTGEAGSFVAGTTQRGRSPWFRHFTAGERFDAALGAARAAGADGIKAHSGFAPDELKRLGAAARRYGLPLWTHGFVGPARPADAVAAGATSLSHADMLAYAGAEAGERAAMGSTYVARTRAAMDATPVDGPQLGRLFAAMRRRGACVEPTFFVFTPREPDPVRDAYVRWAAQATGRAQREGVPVCAGTDGLGGGTANLPEELALLVNRAGLTPLQALTAATLNNARALGLADRGRIASGLRADLVVLDADPALDIANVKRVRGVVARGVWHEPTRRRD